MPFALVGKLLDVEWILSRDAQRSGAELEQHDRALLAQATAANPEQRFDAWLEARRRELGYRTPGIRARELLTVLHVVLVGVALLAGGGVAKALLHEPSAREPTNVLTFCFATLLWPLLWLLGTLSLLALRGRLGRSVLLEDLYLVGVAALGRLSRAAPDADVARQWRALRRSGRRYQDLEVGTLLAAAQWYPIAFHAGAALVLAGSALASDLAFAWSTTDDSLRPETLASVFAVLTAPWCETLGLGCVGRELVEATQFSRFAGGYAQPHGAAASGAWWTALLGCLLFYGVLPRLVFALLLGALVQRRSARLGERVLELRGRLHGVTVRVNEPQPSPVVPAAVEAQAAQAAAGQLACWVIAWRGAQLEDARLAAACARLGLRAERRDAAGDGDVERDEALLQGDGTTLGAVLLLVDGWEAPDKATRRFVQALRQKRDRPVFVGVLLEREGGPALRIWQDRLGLLEDPGLSVEAIVTAAPGAQVSA